MGQPGRTRVLHTLESQREPARKVPLSGSIHSRIFSLVANASGHQQRSFYRTFSRPVALVFLSAMFTYQVVYWSWLQLEAVETRRLEQGT